MPKKKAQPKLDKLQAAHDLLNDAYDLILQAHISDQSRYAQLRRNLLRCENELTREIMQLEAEQ